jgi:hypothetical protein
VGLDAGRSALRHGPGQPGGVPGGEPRGGGGVPARPRRAAGVGAAAPGRHPEAAGGGAGGEPGGTAAGAAHPPVAGVSLQPAQPGLWPERGEPARLLDRPGGHPAGHGAVLRPRRPGGGRGPLRHGACRRGGPAHLGGAASGNRGHGGGHRAGDAGGATGPGRGGVAEGRGPGGEGARLLRCPCWKRRPSPETLGRAAIAPGGSRVR